MRTIVDNTATHQIVKISSPNRNPSYQVEDKTVVAGSAGFVVVSFPHLRGAREYLDITRKVVCDLSKLSQPKSAYPEQQRGFKRSPKHGRR
tara:strand:- start:1073 stop:1345 length:273 start_codon:yes stop_codon:yes gene_type:complete